MARAEDMTPHDRLLHSLEFRVQSLRHSLAHHEDLLEQAKRMPPDDPGVLLADKLYAAE